MLINRFNEIHCKWGWCNSFGRTRMWDSQRIQLPCLLNLVCASWWIATHCLDHTLCETILWESCGNLSVLFYQPLMGTRRSSHWGPSSKSLDINQEWAWLKKKNSFIKKQAKDVYMLSFSFFFLKTLISFEMQNHREKERGERERLNEWMNEWENFPLTGSHPRWLQRWIRPEIRSSSLGSHLVKGLKYSGLLPTLSQAH